MRPLPSIVLGRVLLVGGAVSAVLAGALTPALAPRCVATAGRAESARRLPEAPPREFMEVSSEFRSAPWSHRTTLPVRPSGFAVRRSTETVMEIGGNHGPKAQAIEQWAERIRRLGPVAPAVFVLLFVANAVLCLPTAVLTSLGGFLFGAARGFVWVWIGAMLGASAAFGLSRKVGRRWIQNRIARRPLLRAVEQAVSEEGWKIVILARLAPGSPFFLLNYLFGVTRIGFGAYFWSTAVSIIPGTFLFVYLGSLGNLAISDRVRSPAEWTLYGAGLAAVVTAVVLITRRARQVLHRKLDRLSRPPETDPRIPPDS